jgi:hypothetical protein
MSRKLPFARRSSERWAFRRRSIESLDKSSAQHKPVVNMRLAESSRSLMCACILDSFRNATARLADRGWVVTCPPKTEPPDMLESSQRQEDHHEDQPVFVGADH